MEPLEHDLNGPFVRSAHGATTEGQSETVYAQRVEYVDGDVQYWNARHTPFTDEQMRASRQHAYKWATADNRVKNFEAVERVVTITATEWTERLDADRG